MHKKPLIALDCDGVLLDYSLAYASLWKRAFGTYPKEKNPNAYSHFDRWDVARLSGEKLQRLRSCMDWHFWSTMEPIVGAVESCHELVKMGYDLVCVTAIDHKNETQRWENLVSMGFPLKEIYATGSDKVDGNSPKAKVLNDLRPMYFVDDFADYFIGVDHSTCVLLNRNPDDNSPNVGKEELYDFSVSDLNEFVSFFEMEGDKCRN
ncbi:MAG TPA: hypothetical protein VFM18_21335 [Methanosarcina sp.]|nr:hypothetical protein [Methanosarcina sp.]